MLLIDEAARKCGITPEFLIIGSSGPCDYPPSTERFNYEFIEFNEKALLKNPHGLYRAIASCDAIFDIGEGDSFSDIYGAKRLIKLLVSKGMALGGRVPLILSPQTIGPFKSDWGTKASAWAMKKSTMVFARDHQSFDVLKQLNIPNRDEVIDVAFALPFERQSEQRDPSKLAVGLSVSALLHHGGYEGTANQFGLRADYKALTDRLIRTLLERGHEVHLVPHVIPIGFPAEDDYTVSQQLQQRYPELKLAPRFKGRSKPSPISAAWTSSSARACTPPLVPFRGRTGRATGLQPQVRRALPVAGLPPRGRPQDRGHRQRAGAGTGAPGQP